jgi:hypothetical protein
MSAFWDKAICAFVPRCPFRPLADTGDCDSKYLPKFKKTVIGRNR